MDKAFPSQGIDVSSSLTPANPIYQSPDGSANFHRGNLTTQPKAMRSDTRNIRLSVCGLNRRVRDGLPQLPASGQEVR
jgi:hypothetical protein